MSKGNVGRGHPADRLSARAVGSESSLLSGLTECAALSLGERSSKPLLGGVHLGAMTLSAVRRERGRGATSADALV